MAKAHPKSKARVPKSARPHKSRRSPKPESASPDSAAIVPVVTPAPIIVQGTRVRELKREEIELLKRTVARGTSDDEFALFLWVARKHKLDPLTRQLHCVMRSVSKHHQDEKGIWVGGEQMTIQMGIDGYRSLAGRDHKDFGGCDEPEFEFDGEATGKKKIPVKATIRLWKKGLEHPVVGVAYWDEYAPADLTKPQAFMWSKMPKHMLAKCAEALAIRKGYPELSDIYTDEEMHQADQDYSPSGRQLVDAQGMSPSGLTVTYDARKRGEVEAEVDRQIAEHKANREAQDAKNAAKPIDVKAEPTAAPAPPVQQPAKPQGTVTVDWTGNPNGPIVRGDIEALVELIQHNCTAIWGKDSWWHILPTDVKTVKEMCFQLGFQLNEIVPKASGGVRHDLPEKTTAQGRGSGQSGHASDAAPAVVLKAVLESYTEKMTKKKQPMMSVLLKTEEKGKIWGSVFDHDLFPFIAKAQGKPCEFYVKESAYGPNITGILKIGNREFIEGKIPVVGRDEPRGGNLFA